MNPGAGSESTSPPHPTGMPSPSQSPGWVSMHPGLKVLLSSLGTAGSCLRNPKKPPVPQVRDRACPPLSPHSCTPACSPRGHRTQHQGSQLHPNIVCVWGGLLPEQLFYAPGRATAAIWQCHGPQDPGFWCPGPLALLGAPILAVLGFSRQVWGWQVGELFPQEYVAAGPGSPSVCTQPSSGCSWTHMGLTLPSWAMDGL